MERDGSSVSVGDNQNIVDANTYSVHNLMHSSSLRLTEPPMHVYAEVSSISMNYSRVSEYRIVVKISLK